MTVAEIKEYIDEKIQASKTTNIMPDKAQILYEAMIEIKYRLDELEENNK